LFLPGEYENHVCCKGFPLPIHRRWRFLDETNSWAGTVAKQLVFTDSNTGFILTDDKLFGSIDGGKTWNLHATLNGGYSMLVFPDKLHGFAAGGGTVEQDASINITSIGVLSFTGDGGHSWVKLDSGSWLNHTQRFNQITAMDFHDAENGVIAMDDQTLNVTSDAGMHWKVIHQNLPGSMAQVKYELAGRLYLISGNKLFSSADNGKTIGLEFTGIDDFLKITVTPDNQIFLAGRSGQIFKRM
jgi:photosystem II stability/assembly factor-like uncharacterized protein